MVSAPQAQERPTAPSGPPPPPEGGPFGMNVALLISVLIHLLALVILAMVAVLKPRRPSEVPIFELVSLEKPKLRPLQPKVQPPPEPEPPPPEPVKAPEAPKLTPKPEKAVVPKKPEPKIVKEPEPEEKPVREVAPEQQVLQQKVEMNVPADPRLGLWAGRVKKKIDNQWNPPVGLDVVGVVQAVVNFKVSRDGTISSPSIAESSGNAELDELALMAIQRVATVPPLPENWPGEELEVRCELKYQGN